VDLNRLISGIKQSGLASGLAGGVAGGALTSALMSKKGRKHAGTALKLGGLAAIGGLAWKAYESYRDGQSDGNRSAPELEATPARDATVRRLQPSSQATFEIDSGDASDGSKGLLLVRAMIDAAKADGHIDAGEKQRIFKQVETLDLSGAEKAFLFDELARPASIGQIVANVNDMETAVEVYAAALLAIDGTCTRGQAYLENLATLLALPAPLVREIHAQAAAQAEAA